MITKTPLSLLEHEQTVNAVRADAEALPPSAVSDPDMPVRHFIDEAMTAVAGARQHTVALTAVGFGPEKVQALAIRIAALQSAQTLWNTERNRGRSEPMNRLIEEANEKRRYLLDASDLALRNDPDALDRLSTIREGEGLPDLVQDLGDIALLLSDRAPAYTAVGLDPDTLAHETAFMRDALQAGLSEEDAAKTISGYKDMRDRCYVLAKAALSDLRAFAKFAFRDDTTNARRGLFFSAYQRRRNLRRRGPDTSVSPEVVSVS